MKRTVSQVMSRELTMVSVDSTLKAAELRMLKYKRRCVPVVDDVGNIFGVLSYSDILNFRIENGNLAEIAIWELCSHKVLSISKEASLGDAVKMMSTNKVHHVLVLDGKQVEGMLSIMDIIVLFEEQIVAFDSSEEEP